MAVPLETQKVTAVQEEATDMDLMPGHCRATLSLPCGLLALLWRQPGASLPTMVVDTSTGSAQNLLEDT